MKYILLIVGILLAAAGCAQRSDAPAADAPVPVVETFRTELQEIAPVISSFGTISYVRKADIASSVEGTLERRYVQEGDRVRSGQLLARLSNVQLEIRKNQAEAAVTSARANLSLAQEQLQDGRRSVEARFLSLEKAEIELEQKILTIGQLEQDLEDKRQLLEVDGITPAAVESAQRDLQAAQAQLAVMRKEIAIQSIGLRDRDILSRGLSVPDDAAEWAELLVALNTLTLKAKTDVAEAQLESALKELASAEELISELELHAPLHGIVGTIYKEIGERIQQNDSVFTLFQSVDMYVVFPIQEEELVSVSTGMEVDIAVDSFPEATFTGTIRIVSPIVDPESGNVTVKALIENRERRLRPGMFSRVTVRAGQTERRILIPESSFVQRNGESGVVLIVRGGRAFRRNVKLGVQREGNIEVLEGLSEGEEVIASPSPLLGEGAEVDVQI